MTRTGVRVGALTCAILIGGCGGGAHPPSRSAQLAQARTEYFQLASASAALRGAAAVEAVDGRRPSAAAMAQLTSDAQMLRRLSPRYSLLRFIVARLTAAIVAFRGAQSAGSLRNAGRAALRATDSVNRQLGSFSARNPGASPAIPE